MRQLLRYAPLLALHVACSVYDESLVGGGSSSVGGTSGSGSSSNGGSGGISSGGGGITGGTGSSDAGGMAGAGGDGDGGSDSSGGGTAGGGGGTAGSGGSTGGGTGATGGASGGSGGSGGGTPVVVGLIDDFEDGNNATKLGTYWFVAADESPDPPCTILPTNSRPVLLPEPRGGSNRAMHFQGTGCSGWGAQGGFDLKGATAGTAYDASGYAGISFWARRGSATTDDILSVEIATNDTHPLGGKCDDPNGASPTPSATDDCYGHYVWSDTFTTDWKEVHISFETGLTKAPGAGPSDIDKSALRQILFSWKVGTDFDFWIDDVKFYE